MFTSTNTASRQKSVLFSSLAILASFFLLPLQAGAADAKVDVKANAVASKGVPALAAYPGVSEEEFIKTTKLVRETNPYNNPNLAYEMRLPKTWTDNVQQPPISAVPGRSLLSGNVLGILGRYIAAPRNLLRSNITVEAQEMYYEISAKNWFVNFIQSSGFSLTAMTEKSSREIEAFYIQVDRDQTYGVRARVIIDGPNLVMIRYYLPQENFEEERGLQTQVLASFKLVNATGARIEQQNEYGFLDQSYFNYPKSWRLKEKSILSIERMSAQLTRENASEEGVVLNGHMKINVVSRLLKTTLAQEIDSFRKNLVIPHYSIGDFIDSVSYKYNPSIKMGKAQSYKLVPDDRVNLKSYEILVTVMQGDDYYYITSMITPSRTEDYYMWARNMEVAKIVNESIRGTNLKLEYDPNDPYYDYLKEAQ